jgi:phage gp16-like protein
MDFKLPFMNKEKTIDEMEEETERLEAKNREAEQELSYEQKQVAIAELKARGLKVSQFSGDSITDKFRNAIKWIKAH